MPPLVFHVNKKLTQRSDHPNSVKDPLEYPSFVLVFNNGWDDAGYFTWFCLYYVPARNHIQKIGELKLMKRGVTDTFSILGERFVGNLPDDFCSLGMSTDYYQSMKRVLKDDALLHALLVALRDCAYDFKIQEEFKDDECYRYSLLADQSSQEALRMGEFVLSDENYESAFKFDYRYYPKYDTTQSMYADFNVNFSFDCPDYMRTIAIVGENGVGKTQMLSGMLKELLKCENSCKLNKIPRFHSCLVICSSTRDGFMKLASDRQDFDYYKCCLAQNSDDVANSLEKALLIIAGRPTLYQRPMYDVYNDFVAQFLNGQDYEKLLRYEKDLEKVVVNKDSLNDLVEILSSGHLQILELITYLCAYIHISSLVIIDELEVHLHPHLIMRYVKLLGQILKTFRGYAILSTHSPLVVREVVNSNVYRMNRGENGQPLLGTVQYRTFGEDMATLYRNIFGYDESESYFTEVVKKLIQKGPGTFDQKLLYDYVVSSLEKNMDLGLSSRIAI